MRPRWLCPLKNNQWCVVIMFIVYNYYFYRVYIVLYYYLFSNYFEIVYVFLITLVVVNERVIRVVWFDGRMVMEGEIFCFSLRDKFVGLFAGTKKLVSARNAHALALSSYYIIIYYVGTYCIKPPRRPVINRAESNWVPKIYITCSTRFRIPHTHTHSWLSTCSRSWSAMEF